MCVCVCIFVCVYVYSRVPQRAAGACVAASRRTRSGAARAPPPAWAGTAWGEGGVSGGRLLGLQASMGYADRLPSGGLYAGLPLQYN